MRLYWFDNDRRRVMLAEHELDRMQRVLRTFRERLANPKAVPDYFLRAVGVI